MFSLSEISSVTVDVFAVFTPVVVMICGTELGITLLHRVKSIFLG